LGLRPTCPLSEAEAEQFGGIPRVDLMPPGGVFLWVLMEDLRLHYEVQPRVRPEIQPINT
jgi:hypothetical protein